MIGRWMMSALAAAAAATAGPAAAAEAAVITFDGDVLVYTAEPGEANDVLLTLGTQEFQCDMGPSPCVEVSDGGAADISFPEDRCKSESGGVECAAPQSIVANLGDGDDSLLDWDGPSVIDGGAGNEAILEGNGGADVIAGGPGNDGLSGGPGDDRLDGGDGDDFLEGFGTDSTATGGTDVYAGGAGKDRVDYSNRTEALTLTVDGAANDGAAGELDTIGIDVEQVRGGEAADSLTGNVGANWLHGGGGDDTVHGGAGEDQLFGGTGDDRVFGEDGQDMIEGGDGSDEVDGGGGIDRLYGDEVQICIPSDCATGMDRIAARDGVGDEVFCGPGEDVAILDAVDEVPGGGDETCERVDRSPAGGDGGDAPGADVIAPRISEARASRLRRGRATTLRFTLSEPATVTLRAQRRMRRAGATRYRKVSGKRTISGAAGTNRVRFDGRLGSRRLKPGRYRLVLVATDAAGNKAPPRRLKLRVVR